MDLQYYGANCVRINTKQAVIVVDDTLPELGLKSITKPTDVSLFTALPPANPPASRLLLADPGEYEVGDVSIRGIAARAHMDEAGQKTATIYKIDYADLRLAVLGHVYPDLSDDQLEALGTVDVLVLPVGGHGYTLDAVGALKLIKEIEPKLVIPTHYDDPKITYPMPQASLEAALKELGMEPAQTLDKIKLKAADLGETTQLVVLNRQ